MAGQYDEGERLGGENDVAGFELSHGWETGSEISGVGVRCYCRKAGRQEVSTVNTEPTIFAKSAPARLG